MHESGSQKVYSGGGEWISRFPQHILHNVFQDLTEDYSQRNVPIWLALSLVIAYIVGGAFIFQGQNCVQKML